MDFPGGSELRFSAKAPGVYVLRLVNMDKLNEDEAIRFLKDLCDEARWREIKVFASSRNGLPRMGPIFSSMLLSGRKVADIIAKDLATTSHDQH